MLSAALDVAWLLLGASMLACFVRLLRGPDLLDRVLALDALYINAAAVLVLYGAELGTGHHYEAALLIAILGFVTTVAFAKYVMRGRLIDEGES